MPEVETPATESAPFDPKKLHIVHFSPNIDEPSVAAMINAMELFMASGARRICLAISSNGGAMKDGFEAHNYLRSLRLDELRTHNMGTVASAAVMPFVAGSVRVACPNSGFLIHGPNMSLTAEGTGIQLNRGQIAEYDESCHHFHRRLAITIAAQTRLSVAEVMEMIGDTHFTPAKAKKVGLTHKTAMLKREPGAKYIHIGAGQISGQC